MRMAKKYVAARRSQVISSRKRYALDIKKINDVTSADEAAFEKAQERRERRNAKRLEHRQ